MFLLTEGERLHSAELAAEFLLVVVHAINLDAGTHLVACRRGPVSPPPFALKARQWETVLLEPEPWPAPA